MNCTVYTVMEGHGNTTDNQNNNQNFIQGLLFSRLFKNKNNVCKGGVQKIKMEI